MMARPERLVASMTRAASGRARPSKIRMGTRTTSASISVDSRSIANMGQAGRFHWSLDRQYIPWLARWASSDRIGIDDGTNTYSYVQNRPISQLDPKGTDSIGIAGGVGTCSAKPDPKDITLINPDLLRPLSDDEL